MKPARLSVIAFLALCFASWGADAPLRISIVPTQNQTQKKEQSLETQFYVLFLNVSDKPVKVFEDWSSWGFWTLSFQIVDTRGRKHLVTREGAHNWARNFPATFELAPGGAYIRSVDLKRDWEPRDLDWGGGAAKITTIFSQPDYQNPKVGGPSAIADKDVWVGSVESKPQTFQMWWR